MTRETAREIEEQAAEWAARADRGLSPDERSSLDGWLAGDARRLGAYGRMRAIATQTERAAAFGPDYDPADFTAAPVEDMRLSRRRLLVGGAMAASVAGLAVGWQWLDAGGRVQTKKGEVRQLALQDGSVITLNTASAVAVRLTDKRRDIRLIEGEALFDVAHDPQRPFVVTAGASEVRAIGTSFTVRFAPAEVQIMVREGVVAVRGPAASGAIRLTARMRATVPLSAGAAGALPAPDVASLPIEQIHRELAWKDGKLAFEGQTLAAAAAEFARYSDTRIIVTDPGLAREEIAGLYQANDPIGFAQAAAASLRAHATIADGEVKITRQAF